MNSRHWVKQRAAAKYLSTSPATLLRLRQSGVLIEGICWRRMNPLHRNSDVVYDLIEVERVLNGNKPKKASQLVSLIGEACT